MLKGLSSVHKALSIQHQRKGKKRKRKKEKEKRKGVGPLGLVIQAY